MEQIEQYFPSISDAQKHQLAALSALYTDWNNKINVISRKDIDNFYEHHVLTSLAIAKIVDFMPGTRILDVGTGGGFPGVPLAILFPQVDFLLVDSVGKKLKVVDDVTSQIGLKNVKTLHERAENIPDKFDFVTSRAVARLDEVWRWISPKIAHDSKNTLENGLLYLKGGDISAELPTDVTVQRWELSDWFSEPHFNEKALVHIANKVNL